MKNITLSQCQLTIAGTALKNIRITACKITHALAEDSYAKLKILSKTLKIDDLLGKPISLHIENISLFTGITIKATQKERSDSTLFSIIIRSKIYPLKKSYHNRIFTEKTARDLLKTILEPYGFMIEFQLKNKLFIHPLITQYQQSDFDLLQSIMAQNGLFFYFNDENLIITDHYPQIKPIELAYINQASLKNSRTCIFALTKTTSLFTQTIKLQDYNPLTAHLNIATATKDPQQNFGSWVYFDNQAQDSTMQQQFLHYQRDQQKNQHQFLKIKTNDVSLILNQLIKISDHPVAQINQTYRLIKITHYFDDYYYNECILLPADQCFQSIPPKKPYFGLQTATVFSNTSNTPNLNDHGHYQIKMPYQEKPINAHLIRKLVQFTNPIHGQHFPLHDQTTVLLAYINGELNNPVIIGSLTSDKNPDVVTNKNSSQHILRTHTEQQLVFDNDPHNPQITFSNQKQKLLLQENPNQLNLDSEDGDINMTAETSIHYKTNSSFQQIIQGQSKTIVKNNYQVQAMTINIETQQQSIQANTKQTSNFYADQNISQKTGTQQIQTPSLTIKATTFDNQSLGSHENSAQTVGLTADSSVEISCGESKLTIDHQGNIQICSQAVEFHCKSLSHKTAKTQFDMNKN